LDLRAVPGLQRLGGKLLVLGGLGFAGSGGWAADNRPCSGAHPGAALLVAGGTVSGGVVEVEGVAVDVNFGIPMRS
jgi:hypothetical protein